MYMYMDAQALVGDYKRHCLAQLDAHLTKLDNVFMDLSERYAIFYANNFRLGKL